MQERMHYRVCGLRLSSAIPFPELPEFNGAFGQQAADIEFEPHAGSMREQAGALVMESAHADGTQWLACNRTQSGYRFDFHDLAEFSTDRSGQRVTYVAAADTPPATVRHLFLDQVMPLLLNLRGAESLHASSVRIADGLCAFMGKSGQGKSTLAAAFHAAGHAALCDDCLLLRLDSGVVRAQAAYPGLRLWEDSRDALLAGAAGEPVAHYSSKIRIATAPDRVALELPLRAVYSLRRDEGKARPAPGIEPLSLRDAIMELIEFAPRLEISDRGMIVRQLDFFERVARRVPVRRLHLPDDMQALPSVRALLLEDIAHG